MHLNDDRRNALRRKGNHLPWADIPKDSGSHSRLMAAHRLTHDFAARAMPPSKTPRSLEYAIERLKAYGFDAWGIESALTRWDTIELITELDDHHHNKESFRMAIPWLAGLAPWDYDSKTTRKLTFADVPLLAAPPAVDQPPPGNIRNIPRQGMPSGRPCNRCQQAGQDGQPHICGNEHGWRGSETPHFVFIPAPPQQPEGEAPEKTPRPVPTSLFEHCKIIAEEFGEKAFHASDPGRSNAFGECMCALLKVLEYHRKRPKAASGPKEAERKGRLHTRETADEKITLTVTVVFPGGATFGRRQP